MGIRSLRRTGTEEVTPRSDPRCAGQLDWRAECRRWRRKVEQAERLVKLGSFECDLDTHVLDWSDGAYAIFGADPGEPITFDQAMDFYDEATQRTIVEGVAVARATDEPFFFEVPFRSATGAAKWVRMIGQVELVHGAPKLVGVMHDITRERDVEDRLRQQANQDVLTGLPNRRAFEDHLAQGAVRMGLCLIDIDHFKAVNDSHGHAVGDRLLQTVARRLASAVRSTDLVARLGGDEFAVVLDGLHGEAQLRRRAAALVEAVHRPFIDKGTTIEPSISVGACLAGADDGETLLRRADIALYKAKVEGRRRFCVFEPHMIRNVDAHERLLDDVRAGLAAGDFEVHYQPIVDLRSQVIRGWEALVRWRHPVQGLLLPGRFAAALADPHTSVAIDDFVLTTSLRQMRLWLDAGVPVTCAGVNVSEAQLKRPDLVTTIESLLQQYGLTPDRLKLEVLETAFVGQSVVAIAETIDRLARLGVVCALDDFGTGYASLTHLKQFRVERIKIDRSFVAHLGASGFDEAIVRCMTTLGRDLGIRITAEGIETEEQLELLRRLDCDCGQGYLFGRPMPADQVPGFLDRWQAAEARRLLGPVLEPRSGARTPVQ